MRLRLTASYETVQPPQDAVSEANRIDREFPEHTQSITSCTQAANDAVRLRLTASCERA
ncbi:MAG TPA: hypothetical protein VLF15_07010 [Pseudoxanthomonas sp.]|nr:hypothetical protein [Pseudoxanthomonas sp.]